MRGEKEPKNGIHPCMMDDKNAIETQVQGEFINFILMGAYYLYN
jgi:hypothetical protein